MILSHEFIEDILNDCLLAEGVQQFAKSLIGETHDNAIKKIGIEMKLAEEKSMALRNEYVPLYREVFKRIDFGFEVGELASYWFSPHTKREGRILSITDNYATFSDVILPLSTVYKLSVEPEQLSFFI